MPIATPSLSSNQNRNRILGYTNQLSDEKNQLIYKIKENFKNNLDYFPVTKDFDTSTTYDALIFDGNRDQKVLGFKQFVSFPYDTLQFDIGNYVSFQYGDEYENWLITSLDKAQLWNVNGDIERCVSILKWIDDNGDLQSYPCVIKDTSGRIMMPDFNGLLVTQNGYIKIAIQENADTDLIKNNDRFLFGIPNNYTAFKVDLANNYTKTKSLTFDLYITQLSPNDDIINGIAWNDVTGNKPQPVPSPTGKSYILTSDGNITQDKDNPNLYTTTILQGSNHTHTFHIDTYNNNVQQTDIFTVTSSGVPTSNYSLNIIDGNTFTITNNQKYTDNKLKVICTDTSDNTTVELDVLLGGAW
jgi:hypothetical protein